MRLTAQTPAPQCLLFDIRGQRVQLGGATGRPALVSFFRDAACPFCNFRIYELTRHHDALSKQGLDVVAVFTSDVAAVKRFVARTPRPFAVIADPSGNAHQAYRIEQSLRGKLKAILTRIPTLLRGLRFVGLHGLNTTNILPADFLVDGQGNIVEAWYGRDAGDHIPLARVHAWLGQAALPQVQAA